MGVTLTEASRVLLETLDAAIREMQATIGLDAWPQTQVVVTSAHQARAKEITVQYFECLLGERMAEGALGERRLVVTEGLLQGASAVDSMAAHLVDQRLSLLLFDDAFFLQSDVLGKFASPLLGKLFSRGATRN